VNDRLTLATATGLPLLFLVFHVVMGVAALTTGLVAIAARKGGMWHRRSGVIFVGTMIAMGLSGVGIAVYEGKADAASGALAAYFVFTAWTTLRPLPGVGVPAHIAVMVLALAGGAGMYLDGFTALGNPGNQLDGVPAGMLFFLGTILLLAAIGDVRMIQAGGIQGARRLARHLWRMCFALFITTGSFVAQLVQMTFMPAWTRSITLILVLAAGPLLVLLYWMWRVRLRQNLRGLLTREPSEAQRAA